MANNRLDPSKHAVLSTPLSAWLEREYPNKGLFVYRHIRENSLVIARWINRDTREMEELMVMEGDIEFTREMAEHLRYLVMAPPTTQAADVRRLIVTPEEAANERLSSEVAERADRASAYRRSGKRVLLRDHPLIRAFASGMNPRSS